MNETTRRRALAWGPAVAYMLLIWALSSMSHIMLSFEHVPFQDKGVHFVEYGTLAILLAHALRGSAPSRRMLWVFAVSIVCTTVWGLIDEIHQAFVPGRVADVMDLLADALGAFLGATLYSLFRFPLRSRAS